jgi:neurotransmitter:Na+ symporter, NSS family
MLKTNEVFSSRWAIILASLGMAIGAGNIWRFPRMAGQYGGTFIVLWILFLIVWSIPILLAEFSIGKKFKKSVIGSFSGIAGEKYSWMGFFITLCTLGITFYYSVVTAWSLRYLGFSLGNLSSEEKLSDRISEQPTLLSDYWSSVANESLLTVLLHFLAIVAGVLVLYRGIQKGLELANKVFIPALFILLAVIAVIALSLDGGVAGLQYMFEIRPELFSNSDVWIQALSQSAWSTGAGWGLIMTISSYSREKEDVTLNTFIGGFGNNTASILAGVAIIPSVFALANNPETAVSYLQSGNQALTFSIIPELFSTISGGEYLAIVFFTALFIAAFSSLLPMLELFVRHLTDLNMTRKKASIIVGLVCFIMGLPSAYSLDFFNNQDWVWGVGLVISGLFILFAVFKYGIIRFKKDYIDQDSDFKVPHSYFKITLIINLILAVLLIFWWLSQGYSEYPWFDANGSWNFIDVYSNASVITQWSIILLVGIILNKKIYDKFGVKS